MKKFKTKKIITTVAIVASAVMTLGGLASFVGCKKAPQKNEPEGLGTGKTYYVSPDGKGDNDGSKKSPYDIVSLLSSEDKDSAILKAGDTVLVQPGVYKIATNSMWERIKLFASGEYNNYISILNADPSQQCVLDFSAQAFNSVNRGVEIYGNYIYWNGIDVCGAGDNGLYIGGSYNTIENCEFYNNRDTGLQLGRSFSNTTDPNYAKIDYWPSYNLIKNCTSHNNYDNETYGENADGFAAKLTVGYGNVFDGCIAYRNSDDGWDLYAKTESGNIGTVIMYNCVAYENGYLEYTQKENNDRFSNYNHNFDETNTNSYKTRDGDGNGFKLGGSVMEGDVLLYNCLAFNNRMHGITDNSNPGVISVNNCTSYNNSAAIDNNPNSEKFGYIVDRSNDDTHANIDLARQTYSYNNVSRVLSVKDSLAKSLENDAYRGSVIDSIFVSSVKENSKDKDANNQVTGTIDASTKVDDGERGEAISQLVSSEVFSQLPFTKDSDGKYTYNVLGLRDLYEGGKTEGKLNPNRAHVKYRNSDGSVNMGSLLAVKDYSLLFGENNKIGSELNYGSWEDYTHFYADDVVDRNAANKDAATVARAKETLKLNCDIDALYQDFDLPTKMNDVTLEWKSSDENLLKVDSDHPNVSFSTASYIRAIVYRPLDEDKTVTLTAKITCGSVSDNKVFTLTVKQGTPKIGTIIAIAEVPDEKNPSVKNKVSATDGGVIIVDKNADFTLPEITVENGIDYNGKLLSRDLYDLETTIEWKRESTAAAGLPIQPASSFTTSLAGVYTITETITMNVGGKTQTKSMTFTLYVADPAAPNVGFVQDSNSVTVNLNGYTIAGKMTNATGKLFALALNEQKSITINDLIKTDSTYAEQVKSYDFRGESISFNFENPNNEGYYIYYVVTNANGVASASASVIEQEIKVVQISTEKAFNDIAGGKRIGSETPASTIYSLTTDLDFSGKSWTIGDTAFEGLFNGMGHTISNLTINGAAGAKNTGIFFRVKGGTVMNVKFNNISISSTGERTGIVTECEGGYFYNIAMNNVDIQSSAPRVGGLIAQINSGYVYVEQVSLTNENDHLLKGSFRVGGIIGFSQNKEKDINISVNNCYVNSKLEAGYEVGGIFGTYEGIAEAVNYNLDISYCVFTGRIDITGNKTFASGILGYQKEAYASIEISHCVSVGQLWFNQALVEASTKNCSGIVGGSATLKEGRYANVYDCFAKMEEYNSDYTVTTWDGYALILAINYTDTKSGAGLDVEKRWTLVYDNEDITENERDVYVKAPYVTLNFLSVD
ncbi:MAG: right-handed parallel beta-helix repeat-containing protein [Clostridia bacterium]|nr:right-handed parallel beta-helix repeat-containing protein [Clostridia bacterium]